MAQRRMFSPKIVGSDAFLEMSTSARELYFQLGMYADDDGFVSPRKVMRMVGSSEDDLKILLGKRFVLPFENGVIVIKHWKINNQIKQDRYTPTIYEEQKNLLETKQNGAYTERNQNGSKMEPQVRLGKDSIGKDINAATGVADEGVSSIIFAFKEINPKYTQWYKNKTQRESIDRMISSQGKEKVLQYISYLPHSNRMKYFPTITTPFQLEEKWAAFEAAVAKSQDVKKTKII